MAERRVSAETEERVARARTSIERIVFHGDKAGYLTAIQSGLTEYLEALDQEFSHLRRGDYEEATEVDEELVDPKYNARDALPPRDGAITLSTEIEELSTPLVFQDRSLAPGEYAVLSVSDNRSGMDGEAIAHAFEPFFTTKDVGQGTGLGLATVHGIVRQLGGAILVRSEVGVGTSFRVYTPLMKEEAVAA